MSPESFPGWLKRFLLALAQGWEIPKQLCRGLLFCMDGTIYLLTAVGDLLPILCSMLWLSSDQLMKPNFFICLIRITQSRTDLAMLDFHGIELYTASQILIARSCLLTWGASFLNLKGSDEKWTPAEDGWRYLLAQLFSGGGSVLSLTRKAAKSKQTPGLLTPAKCLISI